MSDAERAVAADWLLSIGTFGRRARLSVKALRLYERTSLLVPAAVDPRTGYLRYRESQLLCAADRNDAPGRHPAGAGRRDRRGARAGRCHLLTAYWAAAERRFEVQRELVSRLRTSLLSGTSPGPAGGYHIREREVPAQLLLTEQRSLRITELKGGCPTRCAGSRPQRLATAGSTATCSPSTTAR